MSKKHYLVMLLFPLLFIAACKATKSLDYEQAKKEIDTLTEQERYEDAILLLERMRLQHTEHEYQLTKELAHLYGKVGSYEKSFKLWSDGHKKGYFFGLFSHFQIYEPFKKFSQFDSICKVDMRIRKDSLTNSKTTYEIITPKNYDSRIKYSLFIILHGGGSSIAKEKGYWKSEKLQNEFIVAFVQSYLYYDMNTYGWQITDERGRNDLKRCYDEINSSCSVDTSEVIIGGISAGGYMAMDMSINKFIPTVGFVAICPDVMADDFGIESIVNAKGSGIKGAIISGENDYTLNNQKQLLKKFNQAGLQYTFDVILGMGHEHPKSFEARLYSAINYIQNSFPTITGDYLGQNKTGAAPEIFAPGIVSTSGKEFAGTFSPDGNEFFFTRSGGEMNLQTNTIMVTKMENRQWTEPKVASFSGKYFDFEPHITPDGAKLYFGSRRPVNEHDKSEVMHQWYLEKTDSGWSKPQLLGSPIYELPAMYISVAMNGNIYFSVDTEEAGIWISKFNDVTYPIPQKLPEQINHLPAVLHPFISPDESYLIFDAQPEGQNTSPDLFISFHNQDGSWTKARNMGEKINVSREMCPSISPDGKYLFFTRDEDIYWVDTKIIWDEYYLVNK